MSTTGRQTFLQTDASINRGNSGGALVNSLGELIGINTLTYDKITDGETPEGLGFAIPIELATKIMDKLIRDGRVIRGYFGIQGKEIIPLRSSNSGIDRLQGIIVTEITPNGPASSAGFQINDIIINVDNKPAVSVLETMDQVAEIRPGTEIPVIVLRDGKRITLKMTVGEFPEDSIKRAGIDSRPFDFHPADAAAPALITYSPFTRSMFAPSARSLSSIRS